MTSKRRAARSPWRGFWRGTIWGPCTTTLLGAVLCGVTAISPVLTTTPWLGSIQFTLITGLFNALVGFVMAAVLFAVVHRTSGLIASPCTLLVVVLCTAAIAENDPIGILSIGDIARHLADDRLISDLLQEMSRD